MNHLRIDLYIAASPTSQQDMMEWVAELVAAVNANLDNVPDERVHESDCSGDCDGGTTVFAFAWQVDGDQSRQEVEDRTYQPRHLGEMHFSMDGTQHVQVAVDARTWQG